MTKEFVEYEIALELKELGFYEPCVGYYIELKNPKEGILSIGQIEEGTVGINAPLFQQALRWFRNRYNLIGEVFSQLRPSSRFMYGFKIGGSDIIFDGFGTYEEAEIECLKQLIKIVKQKQ